MVNLSSIREMIEKNVMALASVNKEGNPRVIAVSCIKVLNDEELIVTDNYMRVTKKNIRENNKVSLCVWDNKGSNAEEYILDGEASYFDSGKWREFVKKMKDNKEMPAKVAIIVKVNKISRLLG